MQIIECCRAESSSESTSGGKGSFDREICDRHILCFGEEMQSRISKLDIAIGSAGGLGMVLLEQVMRLFPHRILIADFDHVTKSSLNRLPSSTYVDAALKTPKVELAARHVLNFNPNQDIIPIECDFLEKDCQDRFRECDVFFSAFDRIGPRIAANQLCLVHGILLLDCGTGVVVEKDQLKAAGGQVIKITPDSGFCLACSDIYDKNEAAADFMESGELRRERERGYVRGANIHAPQVYPLNSLVASWAVWVFMRTIAGEVLDFDGIAVDALHHSTFTWKEEHEKERNCPICGDQGMAMRGDGGELLVKGGASQASFLESLRRAITEPEQGEELQENGEPNSSATENEVPSYPMKPREGFRSPEDFFFGIVDY